MKCDKVRVIKVKDGQLRHRPSDELSKDIIIISDIQHFVFEYKMPR